MKKVADQLTNTDKEVIKYADLILQFIKDNFPEPEPGQARASVKADMENLKAFVKMRANSRWADHIGTNKGNKAGTESKPLSPRAVKGKKMDELIESYADILKNQYAELLRLKNNKQA